MTSALRENSAVDSRRLPALKLVDSAMPDGDLSVDELGSRIVGLSARIAGATCRWLLLVARFDDAEGYARFCLPTTARWLSHACGIAHRTALEHVRVAKALAAFPILADGLAFGRLSYSHARAIARVAHAGESELVSDLVDIAHNGSVGQLETVVRGLRTVEQHEDAGAESAEYVRHFWASTSHWRMNARLDPERGTLVQSAIERYADAGGVSQAEALVRIAELAIVALADGGARDLRGDERAAVVIHLDARSAAPSQLTRTESRSAERTNPTSSPTPATHPAPTGCISGGPGLPASVIDRLLCEGRIRTATHDEQGGIRDLGRSHRVVSERQFRALRLEQDGQCAFPGCESRRRLQAQHINHWIRGGPTNMANLVLLCERHHHAHHDGEFELARAGRGLRVIRADGRELERRPDPPRLLNAAAHAELSHTPGDDHPIDGRGHEVSFGGSGERLDKRWAVAVLAHRRLRASQGQADRPIVSRPIVDAEPATVTINSGSEIHAATARAPTAVR